MRLLKKNQIVMPLKFLSRQYWITSSGFMQVLLKTYPLLFKMLIYCLPWYGWASYFFISLIISKIFPRNNIKYLLLQKMSNIFQVLHRSDWAVENENLLLFSMSTQLTDVHRMCTHNNNAFCLSFPGWSSFVMNFQNHTITHRCVSMEN